MRDVHVPDLTFENVEFGAKETPWSFVPLLYKGGAGVRVNKVSAMIADNSLGTPLIERIELITRLHQVIAGNLAGGGSKSSELGAIDNIRRFFRWIDESDMAVSLDQVETTYRHWADYLLHRVRTVKDISAESAYGQAAQLGRYLDIALERLKPILFTTRLRKPPGRKRVRGIQADKQNLEETFAFGSKLLDICNGLNLNAFWGPLPVKIPLRTGEILVEHSMAGKRDWPHPLKSSPFSLRQEAKKQASRHAAHEADRTLRTRYSLANLRIEAELLIFIGQTGMNLAQGHQLRVENYSYTSSTNGYQVRSYKHRRNGPVLFDIFGEYREVFQRYLDWRQAIFPDHTEGLLFPLIRKSRHISTPPTFDRVKSSCMKLGVQFISPQKLRKTRVNWLLRRSRDADLTAEIDQHTKETLLNIYEEPSLQVAMIEVTVFWQSHDPSIAPPAPGVCVGSSPTPLADIPASAPPPDCLTPAGCLWCKHQRDIDSFEHVWSLCSYRYLKIQEFATIRPPMPSKKAVPPYPAEHAIERITQKLHFFKQSSKVREQWVEEGLVRIEEGHYHPDWVGLIETHGEQ